MFEQPVMQTAQMFVGEMGCWLFVAIFSLQRRYFTKGATPNHADYERVEGDDSDSIRSTTPINPVARAMSVQDDRIPLTGWRILLLSLPAICDICGTTLMNVGLLFVAASIYQMTRGALVLFVGLFSVVFLRRKLHLFQWFALVVVVLGVGIVGLAGAIYKDPKAAPSALLAARQAITMLTREARSPEALRTIIGIFLIAGAQIFTASQFVSEEYILENYALEPLKVVGWEGVFGFVVTGVAMVILHLAVGRTDAGRYGYFDLVEGWREITHFKKIGVTSFLIMISIGYADPPYRKRLANCPQGFQLLRTLCYAVSECHVEVHHRHLPDAVHLDRIAVSWVGNIQMASGPGVCHVSLRDLPLQWPGAAPAEALGHRERGRGGSPGRGDRSPRGVFQLRGVLGLFSWHAWEKGRCD
jgi:drug/metabolite transporter (DMT)-like permease